MLQTFPPRGTFAWECISHTHSSMKAWSTPYPPGWERRVGWAMMLQVPSVMSAQESRDCWGHLVAETSLPSGLQ